jgi:hypothetical protein
MYFSKFFQKSKPFGAAALIPIAALTIAPRAVDAVVNVSGGGVLSAVDADLAGNGFAVSDTFSFEVAIDETVADSAVFNTSAGLYADSILSMSFTLNGQNFDFTGGDVNTTDTSLDSMSFVSNDSDQTIVAPTLGGFDFDRAVAYFNNGNPLSSDDLSDALNSTGGFAGGIIQLRYEGRDIQGDIDMTSISVVPEPAHVGLLMSALAALAVLARRR